MIDRTFVSRPQIAALLGMTTKQLYRVWPRWSALPGFPGPAPGYESKYDWEAFQAWRRSTWPAEIGGGQKLAPCLTAGGQEIDYAARMAAASQAVATGA